MVMAPTRGRGKCGHRDAKPFTTPTVPPPHRSEKPQDFQIFLRLSRDSAVVRRPGWRGGGPARRAPLDFGRFPAMRPPVLSVGAGGRRHRWREVRVRSSIALPPVASTLSLFRRLSKPHRTGYLPAIVAGGGLAKSARGK